LIVVCCESSPHLSLTLLFPCHNLQHSLVSVYEKWLTKVAQCFVFFTTHYSNQLL